MEHTLIQTNVNICDIKANILICVKNLDCVLVNILSEDITTQKINITLTSILNSIE